jgi:ferredoxin
LFDNDEDGVMAAPMSSDTEVAPAQGGDTLPQVTILLDGKTATTSARPNETILETARRAGLTPPFSCEAGNCGTCMAKLTEGTATMRINDALDDDEVEEGYVLTCQGVPDGPLVVDYDC